MRDILERAAQNVAARKKQQEEARAKLVQAPSSSGFKNAVQDALQRKQEAEARAEALRQLIGQKSQAAPSKPANLLERRMAAAIEREGRLPSGTRWLNQGDKAVVVRDFAHKPLAGVESAPRANAGMNAEQDYRAAVARANEAFVAPVDKYGATYGSMHDAYMKGKDAVERGDTNPEYAAYHARMGEMLAEGDRIHEEAEALRPEWMQDETLRAAYEGGATVPVGGWDRENDLLTEPHTRSEILDRHAQLTAAKEKLSAQIQQLEAAGMGNTPNVEKMRNRLDELEFQEQQAAYTKLRGSKGFSDVLQQARSGGLAPASNEDNARVLQAVTDPDAYYSENAWKTLMPFSPEYKTVFTGKYMRPEEREIFTFLWQTEGEDAAVAYFDSLESTANQRRAGAVEKAAHNIAGKNVLGGLAMTGVNALMTPAKVFGAAETGLNALMGKKTDPYGQTFMVNQASSGIRSGGKEAAVRPFLDENGQETVLSNIAGFGYDAVSTTVDNVVTALASGPLAPAVMAIGSGSDTMSDSLIRSNGESLMSFANGLASGAAEYLTEKIPMDSLGEMLKGKKSGWRALLMQGVTEAPGEMLSTMLSEVSDRTIMGAYSNYEQAVAAMMAQGVPEAEARGKATKDFWTEVGYSGALGWLSGSGSAAVSQAIGKVSQPRQQEAPSQLQQGIDRFRARQNASAAAQNGQQAPSAQTGEETVGSAADRLEAAAQAVAEAEQKAAEEAKPVQFAKPAEAAEGSSQSGSTFAQPMAAQTVDGENVQVLAIEQTADGKPYLRVADESGAERNEPIEAVAFADEDVQDLLSADGVRGLDGKALTGYLAAYDRSVPAEAYAEAYGYVYRRGAANTPFDAAINDTVKQFLSSEAQMAAYTAGLEQYRQREGIAESEQPVVADAAVEKPVVQNPFERPVKAREELYAVPAEFTESVKRGGVIRSYTEAGWRSMSREQRRAATMQIELMDAMGRRFGRQIKVVDSIQTPDGQNINGRYNMQTGEIEISLKADAGAYSYVAMHELTHAIKNEKGKSWATFSGAVTDALMEQGQDVEALLQYQMDRFGYNAETALEEVVCNTAPAILQNKDVLMDLYHKDRTLFERVRDWVKQMIADIQEAGKILAARSQSWAQMDALAEYRDTAKQLLSMMDEIFKADGESVAEAPVGWTERMIEQEIVEGMTPSVMEAPVDAEGKERTFTQSIPYAEAVAIEHDPRYAENCGIIGVGYSYNHIKRMIEDGDIPYIIPYHRSGMPDSVAKASHTAHATNYEAVQNTTRIVGYARVRNMGESNGVPSYATWPEGKKESRKVKDMTFDFAEAMKRTGSATAAMQEWLQWMSDNQLTPVTESGEAGHGKFPLYETLKKTNSPEQTADAYIRYCFEKGMAPVFFEFAGMDGYYKTLFDFSVKNLVTGETSLQKPMSFDFMDEMPVEEFIGEMEREMDEYHGYMKDRYGEGSKWAEIKRQAYEEMQPQDGDDVWANSMSDYDADANAAEVALGGMMQMTNSHVITSAEADTVARRAIAAVGSTVDMSDLSKDILDAFAVAGRMDSADLYAEMMPIAKRVLDNSVRKDKAHDAETAELRDMLKSVTVALTPAQKELAAEISGSYVAYKRAARGLRMSLTRGTNLDTLYRRLTEYDAEAYPAGATDQQKLEALLSASDSVQTVYLTGMQENESIRWMADKMINSYYSLESVQRDVKPFVSEDLRKGTEAPTDFAMMLRRYRDSIGAYEKTSHALFDEALHNVMERYGRKVSAGEPYDIAKETATDEGKALYRRVLSEQRGAWRQRMEEGQKRMTAVEQIKRQTADLVKRLEDPTDKKHVQDHLRRAVSAFLSGLDLGGKTKVARNLSERIAVLATAMQIEARDSDSDIEYVFDPGMIEELQELARQIEELPSMADMTIEQLQVLRNAVAHVHHVVTNADMMLDETGKYRVSQLAAQTVEDLAGRKDVKYRTGWNKKIHDMLSIGQLDSFHFFDLLGESGKKLFAGLRKGLDRRITHEADAIEYANAAMDKLPKEQRKALQQELAKGKHAKRTTFRVSGGEVELTRGQIMNLYLTSKRKAAQLHLYGTKENRGRSGIRFGEDSKARSVAISSEDVQQITDTLTEEEKQLADTLQQYLATECAKWGNETSRRLFGYSKYAEPDYWPMRVDSETVRRKSTEEGEQSHGDNLYAIAHMGFTHKLTPRSFNALYMDDVFTVFSKHVAQVAAYNAFAPASLDIGRWYNAMDDGGGGVRRSLEVKFGSAAKEYIPRLLVDLNGSGDRSYNPGLTDKMFGHAKSGAVGRNLRVIIQQPTAILRAGDMMGYQHITAGMLDPRKPGDRTKLKEAVELAAKYSPIAKLKQMGFFETNIGSGLKTKMFDGRTAIDKVKDEGMWLAGKMDEMTFGMLWRACESETRKLHPELTEGSEEFYKTVGKRLSDVIDYTQVVDSPLHRSQLMRSSHFGARLATNFLAEPTKTYNMLVSNLRNYVANRKDPVAKKKFVRTLGVFTVTTVVTAMAQSLIDAIRSDEDEEWWRKFLTAFVGDYSDLGDKPLEKVVNAARQALLEGNVGGGLNVANMIPYVKDVLSLLQGWDLKRTDMQSVEKLIQTGEQVYKLALGENTTSGWGWAKSLASSVDAVTGLGIGNALRDGYAVTNLLFESFGAESPISMKTEDATSTVAYDNLYKALTSGNEADWRRLMSKMLAKGKSERDIHSAMADRLAEDERIVAAYGYKATGNSREVDRIRREMVAELPGWMGEKRRMEIVDKAINSHAPKTTTTKPDGDLNSKLYTTNDIGVVLAGWAKGTHTKEDYDLIISELVSDSTAGDPAKTVQTNAKSQAKAVYKAATAAERKRLGEIIKELFGLTDKDLEKWLEK